MRARSTLLACGLFGGLLLACGGKSPPESEPGRAPVPATTTPVRPPPLAPTMAIPAGTAAAERPGTPLPARAAGPPPGFRFTDVTAAAGLAGFRHATGAKGRKWFPETMGAGAAFLDYDGDGRLDILLVGGGGLEPGEPAGSALAL